MIVTAFVFRVLFLMAALNFSSHNSRGLGAGRIEYIQKLTKNFDFILIQEHWQVPSRLDIFQDEIPGIGAHATSAIDDSQLIIGRGYGGCAILWNANLNLVITPVDCKNDRICAVRAKSVDGTNDFALFNIYMPIDTRHDRDNINVYNSVLNDIVSVCEAESFDHVIIGGDWNTDFSRANSLHTKSLNDFIHRSGFVLSRSCDNASDYTYENVNGDRSNIDHFLVSPNLAPHIISSDIFHDADNFSDHAMISLVTSHDIGRYEPTTRQAVTTPGLKWKSASDAALSQYRAEVGRLLDDITVPTDAILCNNAHCIAHKQAIDDYHSSICEALIEGGNATIPVSGRGNCIPLWNETVREQRERSLFWHGLWRAAGSPRTGVVAHIMRSTRARYHRAVKDAKRNAKSAQSRLMAESIASGDDRNLWAEVKKLNGKGRTCPTTMDGVCGEAAVAEVFAQKYKGLYNSVSYAHDDMSSVIRDIESRIDTTCCSGSCPKPHDVHPAHVANALSRLNRGKKDGGFGLSTDHIINAHDKLHVHISFLFTAMLHHGIVPIEMISSTIIPIPKNSKKSINDSKNYRGIALNSPLCKIFELIVLDVHSDILSTSDLQFGFKAKSSTTQCTFVVEEIINYYNNNDTPVYAMLLDASQAFDCVHYTKLFRMLLDKGLCPLVCKILAVMHIDQSVRVRWGNTFTSNFSVSNGVKQGGNLSPVLFTIYADFILSRLRSDGMGCRVGATFAGAIAYADDIILLSPSLSTLHDMLDTAANSSAELYLKFNPGKCQLLYFPADHQQNADDLSINFCGQSVEYTHGALHLGHYIGVNHNSETIDRAVNDLYRRTNCILSKFGHCTTDTKYRLFKSFCMSCYGSALWNYDLASTEKFWCAWRKCIRRIFLLPPTTHCHLLPGICNDKPVEVQLHLRFINFFRSCCQSLNPLVSLCSLLARAGSSSTCSDSLTVMSSLYSFDRHDVSRYPRFLPTGAVPAEATIIRDFIAIRESSAETEDRQNADFIINSLCTI